MRTTAIRLLRVGHTVHNKPSASPSSRSGNHVCFPRNPGVNCRAARAYPISFSRGSVGVAATGTPTSPTPLSRIGPRHAYPNVTDNAIPSRDTVLAPEAFSVGRNRALARTTRTIAMAVWPII